MHYSTNDPLVSVLDEFQPEAGLGGKVGGGGGRRIDRAQRGWRWRRRRRRSGPLGALKNDSVRGPMVA